MLLALLVGTRLAAQEPDGVPSTEPPPAPVEIVPPAEPGTSPVVLTPRLAELPPVLNLRRRFEWKRHFMIATGAVFHELYGIPYGSASLLLRAGADYGHFGIYAEVMGEAGAAMPRLPIEQWRGGVMVQYINGRFRVGTGLRGGEILIQRATTGETNYGGTFSMYALGSVDVARWSRHALYLGVEVGFDVVIMPANQQGDSDSDISPSATLQLGLRL